MMQDILASSMAQMPSLSLTGGANNPQLGQGLTVASARLTGFLTRGFQFSSSDLTDFFNELYSGYPYHQQTPLHMTGTEGNPICHSIPALHTIIRGEGYQS